MNEEQEVDAGNVNKQYDNLHLIWRSRCCVGFSTMNVVILDCSFPLMFSSACLWSQEALENQPINALLGVGVFAQHCSDW